MYNKLNKKNGQSLTENDITHIEEGIYQNSIHEHDNYIEKIDGKALSSNDFTDSLRNKLLSLNNYDDSEILNKIDSQMVYSTISYTNI